MLSLGKNGTHCVTRIVLRKAYPFLRKAIDVGRANPLLPVTADFPVPKIVSQQVNDIGRLLGRAGRAA